MCACERQYVCAACVRRAPSSRNDEPDAVPKYPAEQAAWVSLADPEGQKKPAVPHGSASAAPPAQYENRGHTTPAAEYDPVGQNRPLVHAHTAGCAVAPLQNLPVGHGMPTALVLLEGQ